MKIALAGLAGVLAVTISSASALAQVQSVLTYHGDAARSGNFVVPALTWQKAAGVRLDGGFNARVDGHLYAQPLYWRDPTSHAAMLLTASESNVVQAFDAQTGKEVWRRAVGRPIPRSSLPCGNINPLGITGTPAIDASTQAMYLDAAVADANGPRHKMFGVSLKDGSVLSGWPVDVAEALQSTGRRFDPRTQNQRTALTVLDGTVYAGFSGHFGDCGDYHGWVIGFPLHDPNKIVSFATSARGGGIWAPGGLSVAGRDLFFSTGNTFGASTWSDGEAVFRAPADLRRGNDKRDFFAPSDWRTLDSGDDDLGGTNPIPLNVPRAGGTQALILALGKDRKAYLLDRDNLGGIGGQLTVETVSQIAIRTSPAAYPMGNAVLVAFEGPGAQCPRSGRSGGLTVLKIEAGSPPTMRTAWCGALAGRGAPIVTTTDGHSYPIVWMLGAEGDNRLHGFRGDNGAALFASEPLSGLRHFQTPIAAQDRLYVGADGRVYAFAY